MKILTASRETSENYTVRSVHNSESAAVKKAGRVFGPVAVIFVPETDTHEACWYVAVPK